MTDHSYLQDLKNQLFLTHDNVPFPRLNASLFSNVA